MEAKREKIKSKEKPSEDFETSTAAGGEEIIDLTK